jgi:hypothetical protein
MPQRYRPLPTQERLQELFEYSVVTGLLYRRQGRRKGLPAGCQVGNSKGRGYIHIRGEQYATYRVIWRLVTGQDPQDLHVDHADGDPLNNAWHNLRLATHTQNMANRRISKYNTSGYKGVIWNPRQGYWMAKIRHEGRKLSLGNYATAEAAHAAYVEAAQRLKGEFARAA